MTLVGRWTETLDRLRVQGRYRTFSSPAGADFSSNDYLGYGTGHGSSAGSDLAISGRSSRLLAGNHPVWNEVESALASWHGADAAVMMTSGYSANEGLLSTIISPGDWVATDLYNHASIGDGIRLTRPRKYQFRHNDLDHLAAGLAAEAVTRRPDREMFIVTESLFSMDGDLAPLSAMADLAEEYGAHLIVDEAHATGCYGSTGSGCVDAAGLRKRVLATVHTGGKALGVPGAYICGSSLLREYLVNRCRHLIFTTALPPCVGAWWLAALKRVQDDEAGRLALHAKARMFRAMLADGGVATLGTEYIVPVVLGEDERAVRTASRLQERGFDVRAVRPPTVPEGSARIRILIHADHDERTLAALAAAIYEALGS